MKSTLLRLKLDLKFKENTKTVFAKSNKIKVPKFRKSMFKNLYVF